MSENPKKPSGVKKSTGERVCRWERRSARRAGALERRKVSRERSPLLQLAALDFRLGRDQGAKKERRRLQGA